MATDPQNSLGGANATTLTPQTMQAPQQLNPYKMQNGIQQMEAQGMPPAQSVNKAANNPANQYAQGGDISQATPSFLDSKSRSQAIDPALLKATASQVEQTNALKQPPQKKSDKEMQNMFGQPVQHKAQGGDISSKIKDMPLKDMIKFLASHPDVAAGLDGERSGTTSQDYKKGGSVAHMKSENTQPAGMTDLNVDAGTYAQGGKVNQPVMPTYTPQKPPQPMQMAGGGGVEEDNIVGYGPDGTPIVQNADGTQGYGDTNQLLGRPESAPTLGTGATPATGVSANAANSVAGLTNNMAKGGEASGVPPGSLAHEVADDVPAKLSEGEFVFSADVVRYYGLKTLNDMMEHARQNLRGMQADGNIRSPGDGKNPDQGAQFMQDTKPDLNTYDQDGGNKDASSGDNDAAGDDMVTGILKECQGGGMKQGGDCYNEGGAVPQMGMATGGSVGEEEFKNGGEVYGRETQHGTDNMVSSHPKGGSPLMEYAKGGIVSSKMDSLTPKKLNNEIPTGKMTQPSAPKLGVPHAHKTVSAKPLPSIKHFKKGGIIRNMNEHNEINATQSLIGA